ncbi:MAG TPA: ACP phosphodiesterase [Xanthomonadales bacterium]|nr:ACP phosphodiesterase [Xanthomonadales bacterium]
MNHLAHLVLAGAGDDWSRGALLGDFWRGAVPTSWPPELRASVRLHRRVDGFVDARLGAARARFEPPWRRYAGIVLDVWFDHLLALDFERLVGEPLPAFAARVAGALAHGEPDWPLAARLYMERLARDEGAGLVAYASREHVERVYARIAQRLARENPVADALDAVLPLAPALVRDFAALWPALVAFGVEERERLLRDEQGLAARDLGLGARD